MVTEANKNYEQSQSQLYRIKQKTDLWYHQQSHRLWRTESGSINLVLEEGLRQSKEKGCKAYPQGEITYLVGTGSGWVIRALGLRAATYTDWSVWRGVCLESDREPCMTLTSWEEESLWLIGWFQGLIFLYMGTSLRMITEFPLISCHCLGFGCLDWWWPVVGGRKVGAREEAVKTNNSTRVKVCFV